MIDLRFTDLPGVWQHFSVPPSAVDADALDLACSIKEIARDSCSSTRLGTHRYSGDDSQSGCGTQANT
jgi:glutamine synthetase